MNKIEPHFPQTEILRKIPQIWWCSGAEWGRPETAGKGQTSFMKEQVLLNRFGCLSYCDFDLFEDSTESKQEASWDSNHTFQMMF